MKTNFYWSGTDWQFLNRLVILSHLENSHDVTIWVNGNIHENIYWVSDLPVTIKDAQEICNTEEYEQKLIKNRISTPEIVRLVSDYWSFNFCYKTTELYVDTDIIALDNWDDLEHVFTTDDGEHYTVALMKSNTTKNPIFSYCIQNIRDHWGNMQLFTEACKLYKQKLTYDQHEFHPINWKYNWASNGLPKIINETEIPKSRGIHYYGFKTSKLNINETWIEKYPNSMFTKLCNKFCVNYSYRRK